MLDLLLLVLYWMYNVIYIVYIIYLYYITVPPNAISVGGDQFVLPDNTVTLIAFTNIAGNPLPTVSWTGPDGQPRVMNDRFTLTDGQITITNVNGSDNGTYTCTVSNGVGSDLVQSIQLSIAGIILTNI